MIVFIFALLALTIFYLKFWTKPKAISLKNKLALISGGSNGLGQNICIELAKEGCNIAFCDIASPDETLTKLKEFNVKVKAYKTDVSNYEEIEKLRENIFKDFRCDVDILINNAGLIPYKKIFDQDYKEIENLTAVNLNSVILMTKCFLERMKENPKGGHIVSISSMAGVYASPHLVLYTSTKFAITGFMLALQEFLRLEKLDKIHTTLILPHVIATRKDIIDAVNPKVTPLIKPNLAAKVVRRAIVYRKKFVTIPKYLGFLASVFNGLPFRLQTFIRDIQRENIFLNK